MYYILCTLIIMGKPICLHHKNPPQEKHTYPMQGPPVGHLLQSEKKLPIGSNMPPRKKNTKEPSKPWCDNLILENIIQNLGKPPSPVEGVRLTQAKPCLTYLGILVSTFFSFLKNKCV